MVPGAKDNDVEDVSWALSTAEAMWGRGDRADALKWVRRAAEAASEAEQDGRALEIAKAAADLANVVERGASKPPPPYASSVPSPDTLTTPLVSPAQVRQVSVSKVTRNLAVEAGGNAARPAVKVSTQVAGGAQGSRTNEAARKARKSGVAAEGPSPAAAEPARAPRKSNYTIDGASPGPPERGQHPADPARAPRKSNYTIETTTTSSPERASRTNEAPKASADARKSTPSTKRNSIPDGTSAAEPRRGQHQDGTSAAEPRRGQHQDGTSAAEPRRGQHQDGTSAAEPRRGQHQPETRRRRTTIPPPAPSEDASPTVAEPRSPPPSTPPPSSKGTQPHTAEEMEAWPTQALEGDALTGLAEEMTRIGAPAYVDSDRSPSARPPPSGRPPSQAPGTRPSQQPGSHPTPASGMRPSQAVRVVVWRAADGVHVAPQGTTVSAITIDALLVALDPSADLASWLTKK